MREAHAVGDSRGDPNRPVGSGSNNPPDPGRAREPLDRRLVFRGQDHTPVGVPERRRPRIVVEGDHVATTASGGTEQADLRRSGP